MAAASSNSLTPGFAAWTISKLFWPLFFIALAGTVVESIPTPEIDNLTITVVAVALGLILL